MASKLRVGELKIERHNELESWRRFLRRFEVAAVTIDFGAKVKLEDEGEKEREVSKIKAATLVGNLGEEGLAIFDTFKIEVEDLQYVELKGRFDEYFKGRENKVVLRHRFLNLKQSQGEELVAFAERVRAQAASCQLDAMEEDLTMHVIINGIRDDRLQGDLLQIKDATLTRIMERCTQYESAERSVRELKRGEECEVGALNKDRRVVEQAERCNNCGGQEHVARYCPRITCFRCGGKGHITWGCSRGYGARNGRMERGGKVNNEGRQREYRGVRTVGGQERTLERGWREEESL